MDTDKLHLISLFIIGVVAPIAFITGTVVGLTTHSIDFINQNMEMTKPQPGRQVLLVGVDEVAILVNSTGNHVSAIVDGRKYEGLALIMTLGNYSVEISNGSLLYRIRMPEQVIYLASSIEAYMLVGMITESLITSAFFISVITSPTYMQDKKLIIYLVVVSLVVLFISFSILIITSRLDDRTSLLLELLRNVNYQIRGRVITVHGWHP